MTRPGRPIAEAALERAAHAARPLFAVTDFAGRITRPAFLRAVAVALGAVPVGRLMDFMVFGATPGAVPAFFALVAGAAGALAAPSLVARRLHDAGRRGRPILLALVPLAGWLALAWLVLQPTCRIPFAERPVR